MGLRARATQLFPALFVFALHALAQRGTGELRLAVTDPLGLGVKARVEMVSLASQVHQTAMTGPDGRSIVKDLPFGLYRLLVSASGFQTSSALMEIRSEVPVERQVTLGLVPLETTVVVRDSETLVDPNRTASVFYVGKDSIQEHRASQMGRDVLDLLRIEPGWVLEANGVLHPRGSEYQTQYVVDGIPITDNRSPSFAPAIEPEELESLDVLTAGYPAEYGRQLGGVIEAMTARAREPGLHGRAEFRAGSFSTQQGSAFGQYVRGRTALGLSAHAAHTSRFLDPPVEQNYSNQAWGSGVSARIERDFSERDRVRAVFHRKRTGFLVPNELLQQQAGQRQDRRNEETLGQFSYQRVLSPRLLASVRTMVRDLSAQLWSNPFSTPVIAGQDRGFRDAYLGGALSWHRSAHEFKAGGEGLFASVRERFHYGITDPSFFDPQTPLNFRFADRKQDREQAVFGQDLIRLGHWTLSAGLRWDRYRFLVRETAFSPRLGAAWHWPRLDLVMRASYDRAFQTPAIENLLLASSEAARHLAEATTGLPVPPSRGNFYQVGFTKVVFGKLRLDGNYFQRRIRHFADDDLLLNTGVSFPIAFSQADIRGFEARLEVPRWGPFSALASYSNLIGLARLPVTGGLFIEEDSARLLRSTERLRITQDQRNTAYARFRYQVSPRVWLALAGWYGSGLPVELRAGARPDEELRGRVGRRILERVNFARGRVKPSHGLDTSVGLELWNQDKKSLRLQAEVLNLTDRLNLINFAGLFSGTAVATPRSFSLRLQTDF